MLGHPGEAQSRAATPPQREESAEVVWASGQDAPWASPGGGVLGIPIRGETPGQTQDALERLYVSAGMGRSRCPPGRVGGCSWGGECPCLSCCPLDPDTDKQQKTKQNQIYDSPHLCMAPFRYLDIHINMGQTYMSIYKTLLISNRFNINTVYRYMYRYYIYL